MAKKEPLKKAQYEMLAAFRYALRQFMHFSEEAAHAAGVTAQQHQALLAIKGFPGRESVTVGELAERLQLRHHSVVGLINRLMTRKLVSRTASAEDHRRVIVQLTTRGENILEKLSSAHTEQLSRIGPELNLLLERLTAGHEKVRTASPDAALEEH
jgi:DNA-binding MarR family transcriptional regulator